MSLDIFDPQKHKIVAIVADGPDKGQHLHVSLLELAMDMSKVDFAPFFDRMRALEAQAHATPLPPPAVDLTPLVARLEALEQRPVEVQQVSAPALDLSPIFAAIGHLSKEVTELRNRPAAGPVAQQDVPDLTPRIEALERQLSILAEHSMGQEKAVQAMLQILADTDRTLKDNGALIEGILNSGLRVPRDEDSLRKAG